MEREPRLARQLAEILSSLSAVGTRIALIGGLALASHRVIRATQDIDLLANASCTDEINSALLALGYQCLYRSEDAGNYQRGDERVDFIYAHRPAAMHLLQKAVPVETEFGQLRVVSAEGLIGLKLQGYVNNPRRTLDLEDIRAPFAAEGGLPPQPAESGPEAFEALFDMMRVVESLCPTWPDRPTFAGSDRFLL
jgi:Aminoglycoside-2''-adenylyltransferase